MTSHIQCHSPGSPMKRPSLGWNLGVQDGVPAGHQNLKAWAPRRLPGRSWIELVSEELGRVMGSR
jgi:hypothetical protein